VQTALGHPERGEVPSEQQLTAFEEDQAGNGGGGGAEQSLTTTGGGNGGGGDQSLTTAGGGNGGGGDQSLTTTGGGDGEGHGHAVTKRPNPISRLIGFLQGSWRELQRVQWPDRRQVFQATGVVLGFVIVAGAFLGLASFAAQKIVNLILYGHG
jgi:preprotein translocase SecE subunit